MINITDLALQNPLDDEHESATKMRLFNLAAPWVAGSAMAAGQAFLATGCSVPKVGKCVGCGSCVVAVITLSSWAMRRRKQTKQRMEVHGLEPFEICTKP
jgi:hypothetical protein